MSRITNTVRLPSSLWDVRRAHSLLTPVQPRSILKSPTSPIFPRSNEIR